MLLEAHRALWTMARRRLFLLCRFETLPPVAASLGDNLWRGRQIKSLIASCILGVSCLGKLRFRSSELQQRIAADIECRAQEQRRQSQADRKIRPPGLSGPHQHRGEEH